MRNRIGACSLPGCGRVGPLTRGWCNRHYKRWRAHGDPLIFKKGLHGTVRERFWRMVIKSGPTPPHRPDLGPCWGWDGFHDEDGYGKFSPTEGTTTGAHRFAYEDTHGPLPPGLVPDHLCRNRGCPNPGHLEPVTEAVNIARGVGLAPRNAAKTHCIAEHPLSGSNLYVQPDGKRMCRTCRRERKAAARGATRGRGWRRADTHCSAGHAFDKANTRIVQRANGTTTRACRACDRERSRRYYHAHRAG